VKAIVATKYGPPEVLQVQEIPQPIPQEHEILVRVRATTVNAGDCRMRAFDVPPVFWLPGRLLLGITRPKNPVFGMELAGDVAAVGPGVSRFKPGDAVYATTSAVNFGGYAEYKCLREDGVVAAKPANLTYEQAAAVPVNGNTALYFLRAAGVASGQRVVVVGASGGVGVFAVQLARALGAEVTGVCGPSHIDLVKSLGAAEVLDYSRQDFTHNGQVYDVIFDAAGKTTFPQVSGSLRKGGCYVNVVLPEAALIGPWYAMTAGKRILGGNITASADNLVFLRELIEAGTIHPVVDRTYPLDQIVEAHRYVDQGHKIGAVAINVA